MNVVNVSVVNMSTRFLSLIFLFVFQGVISRWLSVEDFSTYSKFITYGGYISLVTSLGFSSSILYLSSDRDRFFATLPSLVAFYVLIYLALLGGLLLWAGISDVDVESNAIWYFTLSYAVSLNIFNICAAYFQIRQWLVSFGALSLLMAVYLLVASDLAIRFLDDANVHTIFYLYLTYYLTASAVLVFLFRNRLAIRNFFQTIKENISYGSKAALLMVMAQVIYISDFFLLDVIGEANVVGLYFVAIAFSKVVLVLADSVANTLYPILIERYRKGSQLEDQSEKDILALLLIAISSVMVATVAFHFFGSFIIRHMFSDYYAQTSNTATILIFGTFGMVAYKLISRQLAAQDRWRELYVTVSIASIVNIVLNLLLIPELGATGAAIASALSYWLCGYLVFRSSGYAVADIMAAR